MEICPVGSLRNYNVLDELLFCWRKYLLDEGEGDKVPGHNAMIHELQEGGESEGQHFTEAEGSKEQLVQAFFYSI